MYHIYLASDMIEKQQRVIFCWFCLHATDSDVLFHLGRTFKPRLFDIDVG
jgi:hypothetical protein